MPVRLAKLTKLLGGLKDEALWESIKLTFKLIRDRYAERAGEAAGQVIVERQKEVKYVAEHRNEFVDDVIKLPPQERMVWLYRLRLRERRLSRPYGPHPRRRYTWNDENRLTERMVMLRKHILEEPHDGLTTLTLGERQDIWRETLRVLAHLGDEDFDLTIEALTSDFLLQYLQMFWEAFNRGCESVGNTLQAHAVWLEASRAANPSIIPYIGWFLDPVGYFIRGRRP